MTMVVVRKSYLPTPEEMERELLEGGFISEQEYISRAYQRIFANALRRSPFLRARASLKGEA